MVSPLLLQDLEHSCNLASVWHQSWHSHDTWHAACVVTRDVIIGEGNIFSLFLETVIIKQQWTSTIKLGLCLNYHDSNSQFHGEISKKPVIIISSFQIIALRQSRTSDATVDATMPSHPRDRMSRSVLARHHTVLSSNTSAVKHGSKYFYYNPKYFYMSTTRTDLTQRELYKQGELPRCSNAVSKLNQSDCFYPKYQKTKSEFKISRSELEQNMYVLPLQQNNMPGYHGSPSEYSEHVYQTTRGHVQYQQQQKYEGFRPVQTKYFRQESSGYQVRSNSSHRKNIIWPSQTS